jgi:hypothetical protein
MLVALAILSLFFVILLIAMGHLLNKQDLPAFQADAALVFGTGLGWKAETR